jgi:hypothetical protein
MSSVTITRDSDKTGPHILKRPKVNERAAIKAARERFPDNELILPYVLNHYRCHMVEACREQHERTVTQIFGEKSL